ncbi:MAG: hypothetical protein KKE76_12195 [Gammaproteobacteria bacterium]|nr:hypothetical protein [Gammaproteobacteria bacterium]
MAALGEGMPAGSGIELAFAEVYRILGDVGMLFVLGSKDRHLLGIRSRLFIRMHHTALIGLVGWIGYLFVIRELM